MKVIKITQLYSGKYYITNIIYENVNSYLRYIAGVEKYQIQQKLDSGNLVIFALILSFVCLGSLTCLGYSVGYGAEVFSKEEKPFGTPYDEWVGNFWNWMIGLTKEQSEPSNGSCLIGKNDSMVMLVDPSISGKLELECDISSNDGIMVPSWTGVYENNNQDDLPDDTPGSQLSKFAREQLNLGAVTSEVKVNGKSVARLDEISTMSNNVLNYKINTMENYTEVYSKPFNLTIPDNTYVPDQVVGRWIAGGHGWFVFLKPLPPGDHTISYSLSVQGLGADNVASEIAYTLHVRE